MTEQLALFLQVAAVLGIIYGAARTIILLQVKAKQSSIDKERNDDVLVRIDKKLEVLSTDVNHQTQKIQKVEQDGIKNISLTEGLLGSVDRMKDALAKNQIEQAVIKERLSRHEEEIKSLKDTQRFPGPKL